MSNELKQASIRFPNADRGYTCSCCGSFVKRYARHFNCNMALCILALYKHEINGFVKVEDFLLKHGYQRCGDFSYLTHYGLLEKMIAKREDGSRKNGYYRITEPGILFAKGKLTVQSKFYTFNSKCEGFAGEEINIKQALGKKFNYDELMGFKRVCEPAY